MFLETVACAVSGEMDCAVSEALLVVPCYPIFQEIQLHKHNVHIL